MSPETRRRRARPVPAPVLAALLLCVFAAGCGRRQPAPEEPPPAPPAVESGALVVLAPGQAFSFAERFKGGKAPAGLTQRADGQYRLTLGEVRQPVLCAPAPYAVRQKVRLPKGAVLRTAFGLAPESWNKRGAGVRFSIRLRRDGTTVELFLSLIHI